MLLMRDEKGKMVDAPSLLTVVETVYHQCPTDQPSSVTSNFTRQLTGSDQQMYGPRRLIVGKEWMQIEYGWLKGTPSMVVIRNEEGHFGLRSDAPLAILEVGVDATNGYIVPIHKVRANESCRFEPANGAEFYVRAAGAAEMCRWSVTAIPQ